MSDVEQQILDLIYTIVDNLLSDGAFESVDQMFVQMINERRIEKMTLSTLLAFASVTLPAKANLPNRIHFMNSVKAELLNRDEDAYGLLEGLW